MNPRKSGVAPTQIIGKPKKNQENQRSSQVKRENLWKTEKSKVKPRKNIEKPLKSNKKIEVKPRK